MSQELHTIREKLEHLEHRASSYFHDARSIDAEIVDELFQPSDYDFFWRFLSPEQQQESQQLQKMLLNVIGDLTGLSRRSPLLTDADERDLSDGAKTMRAALRLRSFRSWGADVLHDEERVLGVQPPGQSDRSPCDPVGARRAFMESLHTVSNILELVEASPPVFNEPRSVEGQVTKYRPNTVFVMMWIDPSKPELEDVYSTIKRCCSNFGLTAVRADEIEHEEVITDRILSEIKTSEFLIADLSGERPSVYYEVGYAHAIGRRVVMYRKKGEKIHFDLAAYNCPEYANNTDLQGKLTRRLQDLTNRRGLGG